MCQGEHRISLRCQHAFFLDAQLLYFIKFQWRIKCWKPAEEDPYKEVDEEKMHFFHAEQVLFSEISFLVNRQWIRFITLWMLYKITKPIWIKLYVNIKLLLNIPGSFLKSTNTSNEEKRKERRLSKSIVTTDLYTNKKPPRKGGLCPEQESNLHILANDRFWVCCVYQFRHLGIKSRPIIGRDAILHQSPNLSKIRFKYFFL